MSRRTKQAIIVLIISNFLVCIGMSLVFPVLPFIKNELHFSALDMTMMSSLFAIAQLIASPFVGQLSDKIGKKPILIWGLFLYAFSEVLFAVTNYLWMFDISRIIGGVSAAMVVPPTNALAAEITTPRQRARVIGLLAAAFSGGLILGPGIGGMLANINLKTPFWCAAVLGLLSMVSLIFFLPKEKEIERSSNRKSHHVEPQSQGIWTMTRKLFSSPLAILFVLIFVSSFGLVGFESIYSLYVNEVHHFTMANIALVLTLNGLISLFFQVVLFDRMVVWLSEKRLITLCFGLSLFGTIWIVLAQAKWEVVVATLVVFTCYDLVRPSLTTLLTKSTVSNQGFINGMNMALISVGNIIGPIVSGILLDMNYHVPYLLVAVFLAVSAVLSFFVKNNYRIDISKA